MGKAIPKSLKTRAELLLEQFPENFNRDFEKNKRSIDLLGLPISKVDRNLIAGFISRKLGARA